MKSLFSKITILLAVVAIIGFAHSLQDNGVSEINIIELSKAKASGEKWKCEPGEAGWVWCITSGNECSDSRECLNDPT